MGLLRLAGWAGVAALGGLAAAAAFATSQLNQRSKLNLYDTYTFTPFETNIAGYEEVTFHASDGIRLHGWWLPRPESRQLIVVFAGHRSQKSDVLGISSGLWRAGKNVLLFDWRSRGVSEIAQHSLAYYEQRDAEAALAYATGRVANADLGVVGFSMGAATAILVSARHPEIRAVWADSSFTSAYDVVHDNAARLGMPATLITSSASWLSQITAGYHFDLVRPIDQISKITCPIMITHGESDGLIPVAHAHALYAAANQPKELLLFPGTDHCGGYFVDRSDYVNRTADFFDRWLTRELEAGA
ncbi:MAG: alpha/beta hydrolase [Roseiflexaceae bacterium]